MREPDGPPTNPLVDRLSSLLVSFENWGRFRAGAREAAGVAGLYRREGALYIPFVARRADLRSHPGQVGLPGGGVKQGETDWAAAAREAEGEIGGRAAGLGPLRAGPPVYAAVTNYSVVPFVAWLPVEGVRFRPDPRELDAVLEVPLTRLLGQAEWREGPQPWLGRNLPVGNTT